MQRSPALLAFVALSFATLQAQSAQEEKAAEQLFRAEDAVSKGQYTRAVSIYKTVAKIWPHPQAGKEAGRRTQKTA